MNGFGTSGWEELVIVEESDVEVWSNAEGEYYARLSEKAVDEYYADLAEKYERGLGEMPEGPVSRGAAALAKSQAELWHLLLDGRPEPELCGLATQEVYGLAYPVGEKVFGVIATPPCLVIGEDLADVEDEVRDAVVSARDIDPEELQITLRLVDSVQGATLLARLMVEG